MYFDSHAHLNDAQFDVDRSEVIRRALDTEVSLILNVGYNEETILSSIKLAESYPFIFSSIGWHPNHSASCSDDCLKWIHSLTAHPKVVAIGEVGLDYYRGKEQIDQQKEWFRRQIHLAKETRLPLIIHDRDAHEDVVTLLVKENASDVGGVIHSFSGDLNMMEKCIKMNFMIGISGPVTFKNAKLIKEIALQVPLSHLLIETDCPYLAPHPYRGKRNESSYVQLVAEKIAEIRGITCEAVAKITYENACKVFNINPELFLD